jgi:uncharacterized membrane protein
MMVVISIVKGLHIVGIVIWSAGLIALPLMLAQHRREDSQLEYQRIRRFTHYGYTRLLTPAAVIAVAAGTALLFLRSAFLPWMFGKLLLVGGLVALHAWIGNVVVRMGEHSNERQPSPARPLVIAAMVLMLGILMLVLAKPAFNPEFPEWLLSPRDRQLPVDEVPI